MTQQQQQQQQQEQRDVIVGSDSNLTKNVESRPRPNSIDWPSLMIVVSRRRRQQQQREEQYFDSLSKSL